MQYAAATSRTAWSEGKVRPFPLPWRSVGGVVRPRGGQTVVVLAAPGVGKTVFTTQWVAQSRLPTFYASADTGPKDLTVSLASLATGHDKGDVEARLSTSREWAQTYTDAIARSFPNLITDFSSAPHMGTVGEKCEALCDVWGEPPAAIVIDTASDVPRASEGYESWEQEVWLPSRDLARYFNCVMILCHHVKTGAAASGKSPITLSDGQYKPEKFAEVVVGLHNSGPNEVTCSVVKNRTGKNNVPFPLTADLAHARFIDK